MSPLTRAAKSRENRVRNMARRQDLDLHRARTRDPAALEYGTYWLTYLDGEAVYEPAGVPLDVIEAWLRAGGGRKCVSARYEQAREQARASKARQ